MTDLRDTLPASGHSGRLIGKFRLERRLGSGAMGDVWLGIHTTLGNSVAVKLLNAAATREPGGIERFANEARAVAAIGHENIAGVIDHDQLPDGTPYIVMEYVEGTTLRELLVEAGALPLRRCAELCIDVLAALSAAHVKGIVHRDLKPENVRVTPNGRAKVLDFGVAKLLGKPTPSLTQGAIIGTPHYMAPEQIASGPIDGRADLYAVGVMLFECVTGQRPFEAENMVALLEKQVNAAPPWPSKLRPGLPPSLEHVILKALEKKPERRFASADEMSAALRALVPALDGSGPALTVTPVYTPTRKEAATPQPVPPPPQPEQRPSRLKWLAFAASLFAIGLAAVVVTQRPTTPMPVEVVPPPPQQPPPSPLVGEKAEVRGPESDPAPAPPTIKPKPVPKPSPPKPIEPPPAHSTAPSPQPPDYDPKRFEVLGYLPKAKARALELMSDAVLINLDVEGVGADGTADLTLSREFEANYWFRSPARSKVDPRLPDRDQDIPCKVYVEVTAKGVETRIVDSFDGCKEKLLPQPRCSMAEVMKRGIAEGAKPTKVGKVTFLSDGTWMVDQGDGDGETVYFSCP